MHLRTVASASVLLVLTAGCSSSSDDADPSTSVVAADSSAPSTPAGSGSAGAGGLVAGVMPASVSDITGASDVRALIGQIGFPTSWPLPDGIAATDLLGLKVSQTSGQDGTDATFSVAWSEPTAPLDDAAKQWFERANAALAVGPLVGSSASGPGGQNGVSYTAGSDSDPSGRLTVTASPVDSASIAIAVELEVVDPSASPTLQLAPATIAGLPSISGCVPELMQAELVLYDAPSSSPGQRDYRTIFQGRCASRATFDSTVSWAVGRDGRITQDADSIEVTNSTGPSGESLHVGASAAGAVRIDTTAAVDASAG